MDMEQIKKELGAGAVFEIGEKNEAFAKYFTGQSYLKMLTTEGVSVGNVTFEPGLCTGGRGYYQAEGEEPIEMTPGSIISIDPEICHYHGAAPDSWFSHLAIEVPAEGASNEWVRPVTDEEYAKVK